MARIVWFHQTGGPEVLKIAQVEFLGFLNKITLCH
jgi:hypothetical protein